MPEMIKDGTGTGYLARIGPDNKIDVSARSSDRIYYVSRDNCKTFSTNWGLTQVAGGTTENLGYITYTGSGRLILHNIILSTEEPAAGLTKFGIWVEPTILSGGVAKLPINMNLSSALTSEVTNIHDDDGTVVTITGGSSIYTIRSSGPATFVVNFDDSLILGKGNTFAIKVSAATLGTKIRTTLLYFEE